MLVEIERNGTPPYITGLFHVTESYMCQSQYTVLHETVQSSLKWFSNLNDSSPPGEGWGAVGGGVWGGGSRRAGSSPSFARYRPACRAGQVPPTPRLTLIPI